MHLKKEFLEAAKDLNAVICDVITLPYRAPRELYRTLVAGSSEDKPQTPIVAGLITTGFQLLHSLPGFIGFTDSPEKGLLGMAASNIFMNTACGFINFLNSKNPIMPLTEERNKIRHERKLDIT